MDGKAFPVAGGRMGALMRAHDWSRSPLGPPSGWPAALRTVVGLMVDSQFPMFVAWGPELGFLYNDAYGPILGARHPAAMGRPFHEIWHEIWDDIDPLIRRALAGEATFHQDLHLVMERNGYPEDTWYSFSYSPLRDADGSVGGMFCACVETTATVLATTELESRVAQALAEKRLLADLVEGTDAFVQVAGPDFRWLAFNRAAADEFERVFGARPAVGASMLERLDHVPDQRAKVEQAWRRAFDGEAYVMTEEFGVPERDRRHYEIRFRPLHDAQGQRIGAYQFVYDVTERLRDQARLAEAEAALHQAQKLETIGQLTGGVAHDFNNLLTPIVYALEMQKRRGGGDPVLAQMTDGAMRAAERARTLVQRLLSFSRRQHLRPRAVDVGALVRNMAELMLRSLGPRVQLRMEVEDGLPPAHVDPGQLELALLNLAVNARDAMNGDGVLSISVGADPERAARDGSALPALRITVSDTGCGMDAETLQRATEPFFTTKEVGRGTGLGLSSVQGLALQSGGGFQLASTAGQGTVATLWLPASSEAPEAADAPDPAARPTAAGGVVLLVDDEELARLGTRHMLEEAGFFVLEATSGEEALVRLREGRRVDALVTDYAMPGMSGAALAGAARLLQPGLPVLLVTGYATLDEDDGAERLPRLAKPYASTELVAALARVLA